MIPEDQQDNNNRGPCGTLLNNLYKARLVERDDLGLPAFIDEEDAHDFDVECLAKVSYPRPAAVRAGGMLT